DRSTPEHWNLNQWAQDLKAFCGALEIENPIVLGNSFGAFVAIAYGAQYSDHPAKLVLSSTLAKDRPERRLAMFHKLGGAHAAEVAQRFWDDPSRENFGEYTRVCMPLYNPGERWRTRTRGCGQCLILKWVRIGYSASNGSWTCFLSCVVLPARRSF